MHIEAKKSPTSGVVKWVVGGFIALNVVGTIAIAPTALNLDLGIGNILIYALVPISILMMIAMAVVRTRSLKTDDVDIRIVGSDLTVTMKKNQSVQFQAPLSQISKKRCSLRSAGSGMAGGAHGGVAVELAFQNRKTMIGHFDGTLDWKSSESKRYQCDWLCDRASFMTLADALGLRDQL